MRENADFGALKTESLHRYHFATREQARQVVFEYIEVFYNCIWRHAKIGNQIPADFANQFMPAGNNLLHNPIDLPVH